MVGMGFEDESSEKGGIGSSSVSFCGASQGVETINVEVWLMLVCPMLILRKHAYCQIPFPISSLTLYVALVSNY
jgi:hypothetical protein